MFAYETAFCLPSSFIQSSAIQQTQQTDTGCLETRASRSHK
jgi:hypothetical protein